MTDFSFFESSWQINFTAVSFYGTMASCVHFLSIILETWFKTKACVHWTNSCPVSADPDGIGSGWVLSQTQTEAQTGASHQPDVWKQLRGGEGWTDWWTMDWWMDGGRGRRMGEEEERAFCFSELFEQSAENLSVGPNRQPQLQPSSNQSFSNSFVNWLIDWLIDWFKDWLIGWPEPQLPPSGGFGAEISFQTDLNAFTLWLQCGMEFWGDT